jgi:hypothetical protein
MVVAGQTVQDGSLTGTDLTVTCPDGVKYTSPNPMDLLSCDTGLDGLPGIAWSSTDTSLSVSLVGATGGSLSLFNCLTP